MTWSCITCRKCHRVFFPPSLPDACAECGGLRAEFQDTPGRDLWIVTQLAEPGDLPAIVTGEWLQEVAESVLDAGGALEVKAGPNSVDVHVGEDVRLTSIDGAIRRGDGTPFATTPAVELPDMPLDMMALLTGRSSHMRAGVYMPGGWVDPGFRGPLELEFFNMSMATRVIEAGDAAARLTFFRLPGGVEGYEGRWQA